MIMRENIKTRIDAGKRVSFRELLYPLMQGYDSVAIKADVELGGTDQRFNLLAGRELQRYYGQEPQDIVTNPLIEGLDGRKMSSSWGNTINLLDNANEMFGKVMSLKDEFIEKYFILATRVPIVEIEKIKKMTNPRDQKARLAKEIVKMYHGEGEAQKAEEEFNKVFRDKEMPSEMETFETNKKAYPVLDLLSDTGLAESRGEAKRLVEGGGVHIEVNGRVSDTENWRDEINIEDEMVVRVGKRKFVKIHLIK